jgi:hypothetical protein
LLSPTERTLRARLAAHSMHAAHDPKETTAAARAASLVRFENQVDPDRALPEAERQRRAESARRAHFAKMAFKSAKARATKKGRVRSTGRAPTSSSSVVEAPGGTDVAIIGSAQL